MIKKKEFCNQIYKMTTGSISQILAQKYLHKNEYTMTYKRIVAKLYSLLATDNYFLNVYLTKTC